MAEELIALKITLPEGRHEVHDGLGGVHRDGAVVRLPASVANAFLAKKLAIPADGGMVVQAQKQAEERQAVAEAAQQQARSKAAMSLHDNLPPEVRQAVHEHGDEVVEQYLANQQELERKIEAQMQPRLTRKQRRALRDTPEGGDT